MADLVEAEGRSLRSGASRVVIGAVVLSAAAVIALLGLTAVLLGVHHLLARVIGPAWSAVAIGAVALVIAACVARVAWKHLQ